MNSNVKAFLDMIAVSELGQGLIDAEGTDNGYKVLVGSTATCPLVFTSYADHPMKSIYVQLNSNLGSSASGRYQILSRYWDHYKKQLGLKDFGPDAQDQYAIQQIRERRALDDVKAGRVESAIDKCSNIWASLPGNSYGQHMNDVQYLVDVFKSKGGKVEA